MIIPYGLLKLRLMILEFLTSFEMKNLRLITFLEPYFKKCVTLLTHKIFNINLRRNTSVQIVFRIIT